MPFAKAPVARSQDWHRIRALPVRGPEAYPPNLERDLSAALRTPAGAAKGVQLRPVQARALFDAGTFRRGFYPMRVGTGKTLLSFLLPRVLQAQRPWLLVKASLATKTEREWREASVDWQVARNLRIMTYTRLSIASGASVIEREQPDLIISDESQYLKNPRAAVTRRVARYMALRPNTIFIPMAGTMMKRSIKGFAHLAEWSLGPGSFVPLEAMALTEWSEALDESADGFGSREPGELLDLMPGAYDDDGQLGDDNRRRARRVFFKRAEATPGVVISDSQGEYTGSLTIQAIEYDVNAATEANFERLRTRMERPDGWALSEAMQVWAVARQLSLGLHYIWSPAAPQEWLDARKQWASFVRDFLNSPQAEAMKIDSEFTTMNAVMGGRVEDKYGVLDTWRRIKPSFQINSVEVWHDDSALKLCAKWLADHPAGICWTDHVLFAATLARVTGVPYYGADGLDARGKFIEDHPAGSPVIAGRAANSTGRNLQYKWRDNLVTAPPSDSDGWEQLIGRTHRFGQKADEVTVDVLVGCREHFESIPRSLNSAGVKADMFGFQQKIALADIVWPTPGGRRGSRWA